MPAYTGVVGEPHEFVAELNVSLVVVITCALCTAAPSEARSSKRSIVLG